ncbi:MAG: hypothetical protein HGA47_14105, partial [Zoogloea sp.]|nr:hypothetical protein [Zoogloea sp.]
EAALRFVRHRDNKPRFLAEDAVLRLYRLAQARFPESACATLTGVLDAGTPGMLWDRLAIEASIPPGCRLLVSAQAADQRAMPAEGWAPQPEPLLTPLASELPFAPGRPGGLYDILLQRADGEVRELRGRYLGLRFSFSGDGRHSPAIFSLRAWYPRFSWQANYLPPHFHQQQLPAGESGAANAADLRERLLASFEGLLTPIEDRIAAAECLLEPAAAPAAGLPWLADLLGCELPAHWPAARARRWIASLGRLQQGRGSYTALVQALDILTDGAVARGQVVPVEHFRLRRTLATVLGMDMDDAGHPLTLGTRQSGNSRVGDSLILSDDQSREFLALFAPEVAARQGEHETVAHFFDSQARRLTVLLHGEARALRQVVEAALPQWVPATVQAAVVCTEHPFVPGLSPLLGIDTYLETTPPAGRVVLDKSRLGRGDLLHNPVALSPEHIVFPTAASEGDWT